MDADQNIRSEEEEGCAVEDAARLLFPTEFTDTNSMALSLSEVKLLVLHRIQEEKNYGYTAEEVPKVIAESLEYARNFSHFNSEQSVIAVRGVLNVPRLCQFEMAQIMNLVPKSAEEAVALIPSLRRKFSDDQLETLLRGVSQWITADTDGTMGEEQEAPPSPLQQPKEEDAGME